VTKKDEIKDGRRVVLVHHIIFVVAETDEKRAQVQDRPAPSFHCYHSCGEMFLRLLLLPCAEGT
jgi:hypothetical protein